MKLLVVDGNSILNRAFYGIRTLTTKDGRATNGIYGFMNILLSLVSAYSPDAAAVAFDLKAPTFRHKMYDGYKAGRKPAPPELLEQFAPLKELLRALSYTVVEKEGYEADDILGTLSNACGENDFCYLATGDRDSLQLVRKNVNVLLASTKMGQPVTTVYDEAKIAEEYGVTPSQMIDIKAIMGDASDKIPGVAGIGPKGAEELIVKYGSVEKIYDELPTLDIKPAVRQKLEASCEMAFLSKKLGTICLDVPVDTELSHYALGGGDKNEARRLLASLEMFKLIERLGLTGVQDAPENVPGHEIPLYRENPDSLLQELHEAGKAFFDVPVPVDGEWEYLLFKTEKGVALLENDSFGFNAFVSDFLLDASVAKITDDAKKVYAYCLAHGISAENVVFDTSLAGYLLNPDQSDYSPAALSAGSHPKIETEDCAEFYQLHSRNVNSAAVLEALFVKLSAEITENELNRLLTQIELPLAEVLASMEREGFCVDRDGITAFGEKLSADLDERLKKIYTFAGCEFNVNSPKQLGEILFSADRLALPHGKKTKSGFSTNAEVLEFLKDKHPIVPEILEYRKLSKLKSTYCDGLLAALCSDGRIHSTLNQTETRTGRISSSEPNLQNIPVRTDLGREMRRFFTAKDGFVLVDADYSQIELRVLAALSEDQNMIKAFRDGQDIHTATASQVFGVPPAEVTPLLRRRAKAVNFGIVYGIGAFSLAGDVGVSVAEADRYIKGYLANFSGVAAFMEKQKKFAKENGYAVTLFGRRRYLPELAASNANTRAFGERVAMNMPIQGTAADIIKIAMIGVRKALQKQMPEAHLIMQVHDELIVEAPAERVAEASSLLKEQMEGAAKLAVPLLADVHFGKTWYDAK